MDQLARIDVMKRFVRHRQFRARCRCRVDFPYRRSFAIAAHALVSVISPMPMRHRMSDPEPWEQVLLLYGPAYVC